MQQSSNWHKLTHWRSKGTSRTGYHCPFVSFSKFSPRSHSGNARMRKGVENRNHQQISPDERCDDTWETPYVSHNPKIGGYATLDRYLIFNKIVSFSSLELHYAARPVQKSTYTIYVTSEFEVLFQHVQSGIDSGFCLWSLIPWFLSHKSRDDPVNSSKILPWLAVKRPNN